MRPGCRCPPDPRPRASPNSPRFCSPQRKSSLSLFRRAPPWTSHTRAHPHPGGGPGRTNPSFLWSGQCVPAAPVRVQTRPPAASARRTGEPAPRGELPRRPASVPAQLTACLGQRSRGRRGRAGGPGAARAPPACGRSAGRAGSSFPAPGSRPKGGSQPPRPGGALTRVSWPSGGCRRSFQELKAYLGTRGKAAAWRSGAAPTGAPVASWSRG